MRRNRNFVSCCAYAIGKSQRTLIFVLYADQHFSKRVNLGDMRKVGSYGFNSITLSFICILPDRPRQFGRLGRINLKRTNMTNRRFCRKFCWSLSAGIART